MASSSMPPGLALVWTNPPLPAGELLPMVNVPLFPMTETLLGLKNAARQ
jgi:hypothetical protein